MDTDGDRAMEEHIRKSVRRALRQLQKHMSSEPTLIVESAEEEDSVSEQSIQGIQRWLFRGR